MWWTGPLFNSREQLVPDQSSAGPRRKFGEILSIAPSLAADDFTAEPLFEREHRDGPMRWTGALPQPDIAGRVEEILPIGVSVKDVLAGEWRPHL